MDKVLVVGLLIVASVVTATILFGVFRSSIEESTQPVTGMQERASTQAETGLVIVEVIPNHDGTQADLWVKNVGSAEIKPIDNLDVFLSNIDGEYGDYIEYSDVGPIPFRDTWSLVEPLDSDGTRGWSPGETIHMRASLFENRMVTGEYIFSINAPHDVTVSVIVGTDPKAVPTVRPGQPPPQPSPQPPPQPPQPPVQFTLTVIPDPNAGGTVTGGGTYNSGVTVNVSATPNAGFTFDRWSGDCVGTGNCTVLMDADKTVTAHFDIDNCTATPAGSAPVFNSVDPASGYPRQLLAVNGDTPGASVIWDVGSASETVITTGVSGTRYFQIPETATPGSYPVALRVGANTSNIVCIIVRAASGAFPAPRIEHIGLNGRAGNDLAFTVSAANLDADATVTVNGTSIPGATLWSALPISYQLTHIPETFAYPIYHYGQLIGTIQNPVIGSTLNVEVRNRDGQTSQKSYRLPARWDDLDSDSDGLLDRWEDGIYTAPGGGTVNLAAMGAHKYKKDILMEADWIATTAPGSPGVGYDHTIWDIHARFFADGPVLNPDGSSGVNVITDFGQGGEFTGGGTVLLPGHVRMTYGPCPQWGSWGGWDVPPPCGDYVDFMTYRNSSFAPERNGLFHYLILGNRTGAYGGGGEARFPFDPPRPSCPECGGDNLFVSMPWASSASIAAVIAHEMGHDIGLAHGGIWPNPDHQNWKPNFHSIMNYRYTTNGVPPGCDLTGVDETHYQGGGPLTFSSGMLRTIDESFVDESLGVCDNSPSDLSGTGQWPNRPNGITAGPMNVRGATYTNRPTIHRDFNQWGNIVLDFAACWPNSQGLVRRATCR